MAHQFVGRRPGARGIGRINALNDADENCHGGKQADRQHDSSVMSADNHHNENVRYRVAYIVQPGTKRTAEPQLIGQNPVQIIHDIVEDEEWAEIHERIFPQKDAERQHTEDGNDVREIAVDVLQQRVQRAFSNFSSRIRQSCNDGSRRSAVPARRGELGRRTKKWFVNNGNSPPILAPSQGIHFVFHG